MSALMASLLLLPGTLGPGAGPPLASPEATRREFERLAHEFHGLYFSGEDVGPPDPSFQLSFDYEPHFRRWERVVSARHRTVSLIALTRHRSARVRTLALAALWARDGPGSLPHLDSLSGDPARTFPEPQAPQGLGGITEKYEPRTVGEVARRLMGPHLAAVGCGRFPGDFDVYWLPRLGRDFCASWFDVDFLRSTRRLDADDPDHAARVRAIRRRLDALPADDRAWTLLALTEFPNAPFPLVRERDRVEAARHLGPDRLLRLLHREPVSDDPDLRFEPGNPCPDRARLWVLRHAAQVLRPGDAEALLACEREEQPPVPGLLTPWWRIAVAELRPADAGRLLRPELDRGGTETAAALWRLAGPTEAGALADWSYRGQAAKRPNESYLADWLREAAAERPANDARALVAALVRDPRFDGIRWRLLDELLRLSDDWFDPPVVSPAERERVWNSAGNSIQYNQDSVRGDAAAGVERELAVWRAALRGRLAVTPE
jgi:hypothetical protein